ncbi:MAG: helix-turn-helix transcriptional regulator [Flavipsychrobacter sp.]|nr:helix-turn-helix transcriptional regulator [Flavipsychrobacter sp.]
MRKSTHYKDEEAIKAFGKKVRELRVGLGMTIEAFANSMDLHVTQLSRIERGETNPTLSYIFLLAEKLGVQPSELIDFELPDDKTKK